MARDRWEYLAADPGSKEVHYFTTAGERKVKVRDFYQAIAELGQQGWELVASDGWLNMTFKRRVE
jgi:hypothetical protein